MITKKKLYRYLGRNGTITSPILLENIEPIPMYELIPAAGKLREGMENDEGRFLSIDDYFAHMADLLLLNPTYMMLPLDETTFDINANNRAISAPKIVILQNDQIAETVPEINDIRSSFYDVKSSIADRVAGRGEVLKSEGDEIIAEISKYVCIRTAVVFQI